MMRLPLNLHPRDVLEWDDNERRLRCERKHTKPETHVPDVYEIDDEAAEARAEEFLRAHDAKRGNL